MQWKNLALVAALLLGIFFPYGHSFTWLIRYTIMGMLLFAFLDIRIHKGILKKSHLFILLVNLGIAWAAFLSTAWYDIRLGLAAFITGIMPTAAGAPVIMGFLKGDTGYVTVSVLVTSCIGAALIPFFLPLILDTKIPIQTHEILLPVLMVIFIPLICAQLIRLKIPRLYQSLSSIKQLAFYLFLINVYIAMSKASYFLQNQSEAEMNLILAILFVSLCLCMINFSLGYLLDRNGFEQESSMALGRKNTMYAVWIALTFIHPITALGPMFYIICQNTWHTYLINKSSA